MKDLDFDELDKAVNSLMGKVGSETIDDEKATQTLAIRGTLKDDEKPKYAEVENIAKKIGGEAIYEAEEKVLNTDETEAPIQKAEISKEDTHQPVVSAESKTEELTTATPAARRQSSGRFMDVVHPSSDMRTTTGPELIVPERPSTKPVVDLPPLRAATPANPPTEGTSSKALEASQQEISELLGSPFLPDAKVSKRPLGGEAPTGGVVEDIPPLQAITNEKVDSNNTATAGQQTEETARELAEKLPEVNEKIEDEKPINSEQTEADDGSGDEQRPLNPDGFKDEKPMPEEDAALQKIEATEDDDKEDRKNVNEATSETIRAIESGDTEKLAVHGSIPQQYKEKTNSEEHEKSDDGGIYDVNNYHQPLEHPAKHKSGWGTVVLIVVIILIFVALAAAAYFIFGMGV